MVQEIKLINRLIWNSLSCSKETPPPKMYNYGNILHEISLIFEFQLILLSVLFWDTLSWCLPPKVWGGGLFSKKSFSWGGGANLWGDSSTWLD